MLRTMGSCLLISCVLWSALAISADAKNLKNVDKTNIIESLTGKPGDSKRGGIIISGRKLGNCLACHQVPALGDVPFHGNIGPTLAGVAKRFSEGELRARIVDPDAFNPGTSCRRFTVPTGSFACCRISSMRRS